MAATSCRDSRSGSMSCSPGTRSESKGFDMNATRRRFLRTAAGTALLAETTRPAAVGEESARTISVEELERVAAAPVLRVDELAKPVTIAGMELLKNGRNFIV